MKVIKPFVIVEEFDSGEVLRKVERLARVCYKSEHRITEASAEAFIRHVLLTRGHETPLEHVSLSVIIVCDRGVSHEIVRHRIAAYCQESTRFCNYAKGRFGGELTFIEPFGLEADQFAMSVWRDACCNAEQAYLTLLRLEFPPEWARSVLPNSLKTEIAVTYNLREWRHFFKLRAQKTAHLQMQQIAIPLLLYLRSTLPAVFSDIEYNTEFPASQYASVSVRPLEHM